jgi:hypothetical protein
MDDVITCDELWQFLHANSSAYVFAREPLDAVTGRLDTANKFQIIFPSDAFKEIFNLAVFLHTHPARSALFQVFSVEAQLLLSAFFSAQAALSLASDEINYTKGTQR